MTREYANVWTRFAALVIDGLLIIPFYIPFYVLTFQSISDPDRTVTYPELVVYLNLFCIVAGIIFGLWNTIYRMGKSGQSLGRKFLNIAVLNDQGQPIGVGKAALREIIGRWLSGIVCYIGYLNAFWDSKKQMWHDKMANCYVYYVEDKFS